MKEISELKSDKYKFEMESINNVINYNTELAHQKKVKQFNKIKQILKKALKCIIVKKSQVVVEEISVEVDDNDFNEKLERSMEEQQNQLNEQQEASNFCFTENENGKFYWSSDINRFAAEDRDLIDSKFCVSTFQQAQVQCC